MPDLQLLLDQDQCEIHMNNEEFIRDATILMTDKNVQFKVKTLIIRNHYRNQDHIIEWLLLKSPKLLSLEISGNLAGP
jgi:hypothetical protein